jgi:hypothetical protein
MVKKMNEKELKNIENGILLKALIETKKNSEVFFDYASNETEVDNEGYDQEDFLLKLKENIGNKITEELSENTNVDKIYKQFLDRLEFETFDGYEEHFKNFDVIEKYHLDAMEYTLRDEYNDVNNEFYKRDVDIRKPIIEKEDELGINNIADNVLVRALFETQKRLQGTPDPSYGDYDNEFYDKKTFLQVFDEQFETQIENLDFPDKVDILKKNATELGLHISKGEVVEFYDENWEEYDLDEINDFIVEKITPIVKEKLEAVIENDNEKEGMIFKPVIDEFKDNTRNEFIDFDNVISKFRTVLERDLKNNKEKEKEEEFEK